MDALKEYAIELGILALVVLGYFAFAYVINGIPRLLALLP